MADKKQKVTNLAPPLTKKQLAANEEFQAEQREKLALPRAATDGEDFARRTVAGYLERLMLLGQQFAETKDREEKKRILTVSERIQRDACECLRVLGKFSLAAGLAPDRPTAKLFKAYKAADDRDGAAWCEHPKWKRAEDGDNDLLPNYSIEFEYKSEKTGRRLVMLRCAECGFRNGAPMPEDLERLRSARRQLRSVQSGSDRAADRAAVMNHQKTANTARGLHLSNTLKKFH